MTTKLEQAARQVLRHWALSGNLVGAITALQEALAEPKKPEECANGCPQLQVCDYCQIAEQAEQEPVAWLWVSEHGSKRLEWEPVEDTSKWKSTPLYAAPILDGRL